MSFRPGARQFFERRGAPTPPLPYDAEVDYIESTGTQWIDTGIPCRPGLSATGRFAESATAFSVNNWCFANGRVSNTNQFGLYGASSGIYRYFAMTSVQSGGNVPRDNGWHEVIIDTTPFARYVSIDGNVVYSNSSGGDVDVGSSIVLYANYSHTSFGLSRISSFSIKDTDTNQPLIDLIPVRFTNEQGMSEGAMYDRVSGALFRNAGTGAFIWAEKQ